MRLTRETVGGAPVLLAFADIMTSPGNFASMIKSFHDCNCDVVGAIRDAGDPWRAAAVYLDAEGSINAIIEKPEKGTSTTLWSHAGMYCFSNAVYDYIERLKPSARGEFEITDAVQMMIADGRKSRAVEMLGYWKDLATPADIVEAEEMMAASPMESLGR
jgi:dTDP-glucose pyrophosphorylase